MELELSAAGIQSQLIPPIPGVVRPRSITGLVDERTADEAGCFAFPAQHRHPIRLECSTAEGAFATQWILP